MHVWGQSLPHTYIYVYTYIHADHITYIYREREREGERERERKAGASHTYADHIVYRARASISCIAHVPCRIHQAVCPPMILLPPSGRFAHA